MNEAQIEAVANADAHTSNAGLATYTDLLRFAAKIAKLTSEEIGNPPLMLRILGDEARALTNKADGRE